MRPPTPTPDPLADASRDALRRALRAFGRNATSFQLLERDFRVWEDGHGHVVAYVDTGSAWVAGGEPLAPEALVHEVAERFLDAAHAAGRRATFFATEGRLVSSPPFHRLLLGEQPVWDPTLWDQTLSGARTLRAQLRRAHNKGVSVRRVSAAEVAHGTPLRPQIDALLARWKASRAMSEMGFLVRVQPLLDIEERIVLIAERDVTHRAGDVTHRASIDAEREPGAERHVVALLSMAPVYARNGWLFEDLLRDANAPNGTSELLVDAGMREAAALDSHWVTLGLAPLAGPVTPWLARIRTLATPFFNFRGLQTFKTKLRPQSWEPIWLGAPKTTPLWRALTDALSAFAGGSLLKFALRTLLRGPRPVLWAMTILLVPWTLTLALVDSARWFPAPWMQWSWVAFDTLLFVALLSALFRWSSRLGLLLAIAVTTDALVSVYQGIAWYVPRARTVAELLLTTLVTAAPILAAVVLWGTWRRNRIINRTGR